MTRGETGRAIALAVVAVLAALALLAAPAPAAHADLGALRIDSATVAPGGTVTVNVIAEATDPGIGGWAIDIDYDNGLLRLSECMTAFALALCNPELGPATLRLVGADPEGLTGTVVLGILVFEAADREGEAAVTMRLSGCEPVACQVVSPLGEELEAEPAQATITVREGAPASAGTPAASPATPIEAPTPGADASPGGEELSPRQSAAADDGSAPVALIAVFVLIGIAVIGAAVYLGWRRSAPGSPGDGGEGAV
jgi:hypothetical protein